MPHRVAPFCVLLLVSLLVVGCQTGEPGVKNTFGTIETNLAGDTERVTAAAHRAVEDMKLTVLEHQATKVDGRVVALTAQQDRVTIDVERVDESTSHVEIRVGPFGNESMGLTILERIRRRLQE